MVVCGLFASALQEEAQAKLSGGERLEGLTKDLSDGDEREKGGKDADKGTRHWQSALCGMHVFAGN